MIKLKIKEFIIFNKTNYNKEISVQNLRRIYRVE